MRIEKLVEEKYTALTLLEEKLDSRLAPSLKSELITLNAEGARNILLNLKEVKYVDSSGLSAILTANRLCAAASGTLVLCCLNPHVQKLVEISHLNSVLNILGTEEEGRDAIFMAEIENEIVEQGGGQE
ncbi:MAG: STAS domain-containing protein [Bacteroidota bacterium]